MNTGGRTGTPPGRLPARTSTPLSPTRRLSACGAVPGLKLAIPRRAIARRVGQLAARIGRALSPDERPVAVVVLQGAYVFAADLLRRLPARLGLEIAFLRCESYGTGTRSKGRVALLHDLNAGLDLRGRAALLVDDICDTGLTLRFLIRHLRRRGARRVHSCVLLCRRRGTCAAEAQPDFVGFKVGDEFFVGYGLDWGGRYRNLPDLAALDGRCRSPGGRGKGKGKREKEEVKRQNGKRGNGKRGKGEGTAAARGIFGA